MDSIRSEMRNSTRTIMPKTENTDSFHPLIGWMRHSSVDPIVSQSAEQKWCTLLARVKYFSRRQQLDPLAQEYIASAKLERKFHFFVVPVPPMRFTCFYHFYACQALFRFRCNDIFSALLFCFDSQIKLSIPYLSPANVYVGVRCASISMFNL